MHSCLWIGPPLDSNFCMQKQEGGAGCLVPALLPKDGHASTDVAADAWAAPYRSVSSVLPPSFGDPGLAFEAFAPTFRNEAVLEAG